MYQAICKCGRKSEESYTTTFCESWALFHEAQHQIRAAHKHDAVVVRVK